MKMTIKQIITPEVKNLAKSWTKQKAIAKTLRSEVDKITHEVLQEIEAICDLDEQMGIGQSWRCTQHKDLFLVTDETVCERIYKEIDKRLVASGLRPNEWEMGKCPALVAENDLMNIEHEIVEITGKVMGVTRNSLLCSGLDNYKKWLDLTINMALKSA